MDRRWRVLFQPLYRPAPPREIRYESPCAPGAAARRGGADGAALLPVRAILRRALDAQRQRAHRARLCCDPGGAVMYYLFNRSIEALGAARAGVLLYIQTIFIAVLAYLILGEQLQRYHLEGAALIIAGLLLIILLKPKIKAEAATA
ncbi:DMT family transporter [Rhizobium ruizarguesonis]